jgi:chromosome segregation protein
LNGFILLLFLGTSLAWSVFASPLEKAFGWTRAETSFAFTLNTVFFTLGSVITGILSRDRKDEELKARELQLAAEISKLETDIAKKHRGFESLLDDIERTRQELHTNEIEMSAIREKTDSAASLLSEHNKSSEELKVHNESLEGELASAASKLAEYDNILADIQHASDTKDEDYKKLEDEYNRNAAVVEEKKKRLHDAEIRIAELYKESTAVLSDNERLERERQELEKSRAMKKKTLQLNAESEENLVKLREELEELHKQKADVTEQIKKRQSDILGERSGLNKALAQRDAKLISLRKDISDISERIIRTEFNIEKADTGIQDAQNKLWETYRLTYANALPDREQIVISEAQSEAEQIREKIRDIGSVNANAIEDYTELKERMETLTAQKDDLIVAEEDLHKLIASLLDEMRKTFKLSFEQINRYFNQTFQELFDGGSARLVLDDEQDIMECGIEIIAEPPGKKLQKISLLSGGEKALTAIALLFALLKINPSPVCILDEIDAALDDANVYKLAEYLQKYAQKMQFIVITHKKPTMVVCDSLYGFAMEEKGVSKLLSVRLD